MPPIFTNLRLTPELHAQLKAQALEQGVSMNTLILILLTKGLEDHA
jgi:predicted HicB family RNase H-like nuclease